MSIPRVDWSGRTLRLEVGGPAQGGEFVARHEGRVVFVRGALTGETVEARVTDDPGKAFCRAETTAVLEPSPDRVEPSCPAAAARAGCCDWSHVAPGAARRFQGRVLGEQLRRIGRLDLTGVPGAGPDGESVEVGVPGGDEDLTGWRTAARWVTDDAGRPGTRRPRSHELVTEPCAQADPRLHEAVLAAGVPPHREVLAVVDDDGSVHVAARKLVAPPPPSTGRGRDRRRRGATRGRAARAQAGPWEIVAGPGTVVRRLGDTRWELPVDAFWQTHRAAAGHYAALVRDLAAELEPRSMWDLYGGAGLFAAAVLDAVPDCAVTVVEAAGPALEAAGQALGGERVRLVHAPVERFAADLARVSGGAADLVVLDPPRAGAGIDVMKAVAAVPARRIVHLGCDPAAMARDLGELVAAGWRPRSVGGVAAFPGTHHVEGVAVLDPPVHGST